MSPETITLREHLAALREADLRLLDERDRRLTEVARERERAVLIKETADKTALELARQINDLHLAALNGEQTRLATDRARFLSRDAYEAAQKEFSVWRDQVNGVLRERAGQEHTMGTTWGILAAVAGLAIAAGALISKLL